MHQHLSDIHATKDAEAIKDCIRRNEHVAITLYRDFPAHQSLVHSPQSAAFASGNLPCFQDRLPLRVVNH